MRLLQIHKKANHDFQGVYECETCHGVRIDEGLDSYDDANFYENVIPEMPCCLCDKEAPLSERYQMALDTLAWAVPIWGCSYFPLVGFPSIDTVSTWGRDIKNIEVDFHRTSGGLFHRKRQGLTASREGCSFDDIWEIGAELDASTYRAMKQLIREELVSRVIKDLAAQDKEAE